MGVKYKCIEVQSKTDMDDFVLFPDNLYKFMQRPTSTSLEHRILYGTHKLSRYFKARAFIAKSWNRIFARCILTIYPESKTGYIGFFEAVDDKKIVADLFKLVEEEATKEGITELVGPINCSFWLGYRMKIDNFDKRYTLEPYNKPYYKDLWESLGFKVSEEYQSLIMGVPTEKNEGKKEKSRLEMVRNRGYEIRNTSKKTFKSDLEKIYELLVFLYKGFPFFSHITKEEFTDMYDKLKWVLDYRTVFLAFKGNIIHGFCICIPNYSKGSIINNIMHKHKEYAVMYVGVLNESFGLTGAFSELCREHFEKYNCTSVQALIHKGNISGVHYKELVADVSNYVVMYKHIGEK